MPLTGSLTSPSKVKNIDMPMKKATQRAAFL